MLLNFTKLHGLGNDFILCEREHVLKANQEIGTLAQKLCHRNFGIGADGLILVNKNPENINSLPTFEMQIYNSDGSRASMCGNGLRCVARYLVLTNAISATEEKINIISAKRVVETQLTQDAKQVRAAMGAPDFTPAAIPLASGLKLWGDNIQIEHHHQKINYKAYAVSMGNPHCVIPVTDFTQINLYEHGELLEHHPYFPERCNIEFSQLISPTKIKVLVWERGAGATLACGSGACAVTAVFIRLGLCKNKVEVVLPGGSLEIEWSESPEHAKSESNSNISQIYLTGPAQEVFQGNIQI